MSNNNRRGGGRQQQQPQQQFSENTQITLKQRLGEVLSTLAHRRAEIAAVLPPDQTFESFHATINQALRANPELLDCEPRSLINACVKAGYDGLRVDGKEAAIVWEMATVDGRKVKQARYMPMYQGLVQQVLRGGLVLSCEADVIYANDQYKILRGSNSGIYHEPLLSGDRGEMVAAYNVAKLKSGVTTFAYMTKDQIDDIARESRSGWDQQNGCYKGVWKRWTREQWKKTVMRQHRKTLPVGERTVIRDTETEDEFPQFGGGQRPHPQFIDNAPPRPTRDALADRSGTENGMSMDFGRGHDDDGVVVEQQRDDRRDQQQDQRREDPREEREQDRVPDVQLPENDAAWAIWAADLERKVADAATGDALDKAWNDAAPVFKAASKPIRDRLLAVVSDRNADLAIGD